MIKYAKIINEETGIVEVGLGTNSNFYKSIGMTELDVKQSDIDGTWYLADKCPMKTDEVKLQEAQQTKYAEITEKYDYANKYLILKVDDEQELYANVAWYQTWSKVMSLAQQIAPQSETTTIPSPVRFYKLTPDGKLLLCACRDNNEIIIYTIDGDGTLKDTGKRIDIPSPVCIIFKE